MKGAVAGSHIKTIESAEEILKAGGNAFDATIAACFTMFVTEPCMASAGAGGFAMLHSEKKGTEVIDFFTQTPQQKNLNRSLDFNPIKVDFGTESETFYVGKASIAIPGIVAGVFEIHKKYGSLPIGELIQCAKHLSKNGVEVDAFGQVDLALLQEILRIDNIVNKIFFENNKIKQEGDKLIYPQLADFLDFLADEGARGFYNGEIGSKVSQEVYEGGGFLTRKDFESYHVNWQQPLRLSYRNNVLCLPNGPSMGGAILTLLDYYGAKHKSLWQVLNIVKTIQEDGELEEVVHELFPSLNFSRQGTGNPTNGTTHISVMDNRGNAVAFTCSLGEGSGYWIPNSNMQMNNMLGEIFLLPEGHHSWIPNKRLNSMMTPVMVLDEKNRVSYVGGSGGAGRIPYVIFQVLEALYGNRLSLEEATEYPRMHWHDKILQYEEGANIVEFDFKKPNRSWKAGSLFFGGVHSVYRDNNNQLHAVGDKRRYGNAKVF